MSLSGDVLNSLRHPQVGHAQPTVWWHPDGLVYVYKQIYHKKIIMCVWPKVSNVAAEHYSLHVKNDAHRKRVSVALG